MKRHHRRLWASFVCLALAATPALAQTPASKAKPDKAATDKVDPKSDHQKKFDDIKKRHDAAREAFQKKIEEQPDDDAKQKVWESENPDAPFLAEYQKLAAEAKGTEVAAKSLMQVVQLARDDAEAAKQAVNTLVAEHAGSAEIALLLFFVERLLEEEEAKAAVEKITKENKTKPVQATLLYLDAQKIENDQGEDAAELRAAYDRLAKEFKDVPMPYGNQTFGDLAGGWIFVKENLAIGKAPPDFETVDENGVKWKLSDYRGKVVVIDFWGEW